MRDRGRDAAGAAEKRVRVEPGPPPPVLDTAPGRDRGRARALSNTRTDRKGVRWRHTDSRLESPLLVGSGVKAGREGGREERGAQWEGEERQEDR